MPHHADGRSRAQAGPNPADANCKLCGKTVNPGVKLPSAWASASSLSWACPDSASCCSRECAGTIRSAASNDNKRRRQASEQADVRQTRSRPTPPPEHLPPPARKGYGGWGSSGVTSDGMDLTRGSRNRRPKQHSVARPQADQDAAERWPDPSLRTEILDRTQRSLLEEAAGTASTSTAAGITSASCCTVELAPHVLELERPAPEGGAVPGLLDLPDDVLSVVPGPLGTAGTIALRQTCRRMQAVAGLIAHVNKVKAAEVKRRAVASDRRFALELQRSDYRVGTMVYGAPNAHGQASDDDYDLRVIVEAPTNSSDDYLLGHMPAAATELVISSVCQSGLRAAFVVVLRPGQQCTELPPPLLPSGTWPEARWQAEIAALRRGQIRGMLALKRKRVSCPSGVARRAT